MAAVVISSVSPSSGPPGCKVTMRGDNFGDDCSNIKRIIICGADCTSTMQCITSRKITCYVLSEPIQENIIGEIIVESAGGEKTVSVLKFELAAMNVSFSNSTWYYCAEDFSLLLPEDESNKVKRDGKVEVELDPLGVSKSITPISNLDKKRFFNNSSSLNSPKFNAQMYLMERHMNTDWATLKSGFDRLSNNEKSLHSHFTSNDSSYTKSGTSSQCDNGLLKSVHTIVEAVESFGRVADSVALKNSSSEATSSEDIEKEVKEIAVLYRELFTKPLESYKKSKELQSTVEVLSRYRYLFTLHKNIDIGICRGDFEMVVNDYLRSKSLLRSSGSTYVSSLMDSIEASISPFKQHLRNQLVNIFPSETTQKQTLLRYLYVLDPSEDYCVLYINAHAKYISDKMKLLVSAIQSDIKETIEFIACDPSKDCCSRIESTVQKYINFVCESSSLISKEIPKLFIECLSYYRSNLVLSVKHAKISPSSQFHPSDLSNVATTCWDIVHIFGENLHQMLMLEIVDCNSQNFCTKNFPKLLHENVNERIIFKQKLLLIDFISMERWDDHSEGLLKAESAMYEMIEVSDGFDRNSSHLEFPQKGRESFIKLPREITRINTKTMRLVCSRFIYQSLKCVGSLFSAYFRAIQSAGTFLSTSCLHPNLKQEISSVGTSSLLKNSAKKTTSFPLQFFSVFIQNVNKIVQFLRPYDNQNQSTNLLFNTSLQCLTEDSKEEGFRCLMTQFQELMLLLVESYDKKIQSIRSGLSTKSNTRILSHSSSSSSSSLTSFSSSTEKILFSLFSDLSFCKKDIFPAFRAKFKTPELASIIDMKKFTDLATSQIDKLTSQITKTIGELNIQKVLNAAEALTQETTFNPGLGLTVRPLVTGILFVVMEFKQNLDENNISCVIPVLSDFCCTFFQWILNIMNKRDKKKQPDIQMMLDIQALFTCLSSFLTKVISDQLNGLRCDLYKLAPTRESVDRAIQKFNLDNLSLIRALTVSNTQQK